MACKKCVKSHNKVYKEKGVLYNYFRGQTYSAIGATLYDYARTYLAIGEGTDYTKPIGISPITSQVIDYEAGRDSGKIKCVLQKYSAGNEYKNMPGTLFYLSSSKSRASGKYNVCNGKCTLYRGRITAEGWFTQDSGHFELVHYR